jgi:shikimate kinase
MMGVGKSTVGAQLAARLGRGFMDTDTEIERAAGRTVAQIFKADGEAHFRKLEAEAIETASGSDAVIAPGGGAVAVAGVMDRLLATGSVVYLKAAPEMLIARIGDASSRPLLAGLDPVARLEKLEALLEARLPFYRRAQLQIDASGTADDVVDRIANALDRSDENASRQGEN